VTKALPSSQGEATQRNMTGIGGFWRAFSVICLGAVLIGIGLVYQKLIFARPQQAPPPPGS
jgi:uncharacterized membrane protein